MRTPGNPYRAQIRLVQRMLNEPDTRLFGLERWLSVSLAVFLMSQPAMLVRWLGGRHGYLRRKIAIDLYVLAKPAVLLLVLVCRGGTTVWAAVLATLCLVDLFSYLLGLVFLRSFYTAPASYGRSVLLLGVNLIESILAFAVLYVSSASLATSGAVVVSWSAAVYFSVVTAATVGYGDIVPVNATGRLLVVVQALASLLFVTIVLATFVSKLPGAGSERRPNKRPHPTAGDDETGCE